MALADEISILLDVGELRKALNGLSCEDPANETVFSDLKNLINEALDDLEDPAENYRKMEAYLSFVWEKLNTGHWKDVEVGWRKAYTVISAVKVLNASRMSKDSLEEPPFVQDLVKMCDLALLMGAPVMGNVFGKVASLMCRFLTGSRGVPDEPPTKKTKANEPANVPDDPPKETKANQPADVPDERPKRMKANEPADIPDEPPKRTKANEPADVPDEPPKRTKANKPAEVHPTARTKANQPAKVPDGPPKRTKANQPAEVHPTARTKANKPTDVPDEPPKRTKANEPADVPDEPPKRTKANEPAEVHPTARTKANEPAEVPDGPPKRTKANEPAEVHPTARTKANEPADVPDEPPKRTKANEPDEVPDEPPKRMRANDPADVPDKPPKRTKANEVHPNVERLVAKEDVGVESFLTQFKNRKAPALFRGLIEDWPALQRDGARFWSVGYLKAVAGYRTVPVELGSRYTDDGWTQTLMTVKEFVEGYVEEGRRNPSKMGYLAQHNLFDQVPELREDFDVPEYCYTDESGEEPAVNVWFGPEGTNSPLHTDPLHNCLCQVFGRKYVRLYGEGQSRHLHAFEGGMLSNTSRIDLGRSYEDIVLDYPDFANAKGFDCILEEGDVLYIPPKCWHFVKSLSKSCSISFWFN